jgi:hypothetical protein
MRNKILAVFILATSVTFAKAQPGIRFGIKAGVNANKIGSQSFNDGFSIAYHVGAFAEVDISKRLGIQPEILWNQTGSKPTNFQAIYGTSVLSNSFNIQRQEKLNYLSIPILVRYTLPGGLITLLAGPQYSILLQQDKTILQNGQASFKCGDFAAVAGAQLNLSILRIYARYNIGLQNINNIDQKDKWTSRQIQVGLGIRL